jgi:hypothetical protein
MFSKNLMISVELIFACKTEELLVYRIGFNGEGQ